MAETVLVPQQGNSVESVILLKWHKAAGDTVAAGEILCEVETDKTTMEVESTASGTILKLLAAEGDEVPVKTGLVIVGEAGETVPEETDTSPPEPPAPAVSAPAAITRSAPTVENTAPAAATNPASAGAASPRARMRATAKDVDLAVLAGKGTGPDGRILERDVMDLPSRAGSSAAVTATASTSTPTAAAAQSPIREIPVRGVRKVIAERMRASLAATAQLTIHGSADARALQALRSRFKSAGVALGMEKITINDMVLFALARTLPDFPEVNAHFQETVIRQYTTVDLSFAVDTEKGLLVPTIRDAHTLSLLQISERARTLAMRCMDGQATADDLAMGTCTLTNLGSFGVEYFTPVLNPPQVAILGVNTITLKAIQGKDGAVEHVPHIGLSLTIDHQAVDGAPAARFLQELSRRIANLDMLVAR